MLNVYEGKEEERWQVFWRPPARPCCQPGSHRAVWALVFVVLLLSLVLSVVPVSPLSRLSGGNLIPWLSLWVFFFFLEKPGLGWSASAQTWSLCSKSTGIGSTRDTVLCGPSHTLSHTPGVQLIASSSTRYLQLISSSQKTHRGCFVSLFPQTPWTLRLPSSRRYLFTAA